MTASWNFKCSCGSVCVVGCVLGFVHPSWADCVGLNGVLRKSSETTRELAGVLT
jgi:hypothetical protein